MVRFLPFDRTDEEGVNIVLQNIDFSIQYGEDLEFKEPKVVLRSRPLQPRPRHDPVVVTNNWTLLFIHG